jgi:hypothetical protein
MAADGRTVTPALHPTRCQFPALSQETQTALIPTAVEADAAYDRAFCSYYRWA